MFSLNYVLIENCLFLFREVNDHRTRSEEIKTYVYISLTISLNNIYLEYYDYISVFFHGLYYFDARIKRKQTFQSDELLSGKGDFILYLQITCRYFIGNTALICSVVWHRGI